jgi:hypothetical protein
MSQVEQIERMIEQLPTEKVEELAVWINQRLQPAPPRNHNAFLNSYTSGDEGLYDDAASR